MSSREQRHAGSSRQSDRIKASRQADFDRRLTTLAEQTGLIPSRQRYGLGSYKIVWHLAWHDGQTACRYKITEDPKRWPRQIDKVCEACQETWLLAGEPLTSRELLEARRLLQVLARPWAEADSGQAAS